MNKFIQLHFLTSYPPANLNRDDMGRPKTAKMGGVDRLRVSSQSLKRAWRTSEIFQKIVSDGESIEAFKELMPDKKHPVNLGFRSKTFSSDWIEKELLDKDKDIDAEKAQLWSKDIIRSLGQMENEENKLSQLAMISDTEAQGLYHLTQKLINFLKAKKEDELFSAIKEQQEIRKTKKKPDEINKINTNIGKLLRDKVLILGKTSVDIALFGRMLASSPEYNVEAACQVSHAISVHPVVIEDDYFTAVDDLNDGKEDMGAAHIGETGFASALFYTYVCIDKELLDNNLGGDKALADKAVAALLETAVKVAPEGKQNSFASRAYASYILVEKGNIQPRSLSVAFLKPIKGDNYGEDAITALEKTCQSMDEVYEITGAERKKLNAFTGKGKLSELIKFIQE